jgi:hypothetical protein
MYGEQDGQEKKGGRAFVEFDLHPKLNQPKTEAEGRPIFEDTEYIRIVVPGSRDEVHRPVRPQDKHEYAREYAAFKAGTSQEAQSGTPLATWAPLTRSQVEELAHFKVKTVEQLADLSDGNAQRFAGIQRLKKLAQEHLAAAKDAAHHSRTLAELDKRDAVIAAQAQQLKEVGARLEQLEQSSRKQK